MVENVFFLFSSRGLNVGFPQVKNMIYYLLWSYRAALLSILMWHFLDLPVLIPCLHFPSGLSVMFILIIKNSFYIAAISLALEVSFMVCHIFPLIWFSVFSSTKYSLQVKLFTDSFKTKWVIPHSDTYDNWLMLPSSWSFALFWYQSLIIWGTFIFLTTLLS